MRKKNRPLAKKPARLATRRLFDQLEEVENYLRRKNWPKALDLLLALNRHFPQREEILERLVNTAFEVQDLAIYQMACEGLLRLRHDDADLLCALGSACLKNGRPALAVHSFRRFFDRWPGHEKAEEVRHTLAKLEPVLQKILTDWGMTGPDRVELAALHEEVHALLEQGRFRKCREVADRLLRRRPRFTPALNNSGEAWFREGQYAQAIATARRVLDIDPDNYHALANLTRYLFLSGQTAEARTMADRLQTVTSQATDIWVKKAEALSCLGDDAGVLGVARAADQAGARGRPDQDALLFHLGAVAAFRLGQEDAARDFWRRAMDCLPDFDLVQENLDDLAKPLAERHGPWAFPFNHWFSAKLFGELGSQLKTMPKDKSVTPMIQAFLRTHPEIVALVPYLLDRGSPEAGEFVLKLAEWAKSPDLLNALRDFALGQRGPDKMRMHAAHLASQAKLFPEGPVRLWIEGAWKDIVLHEYQIHFEPTYNYNHSPEVTNLMADGLSAANRGDAVAFEQRFQEALALEPDKPDLLNNLAKAYEQQGRHAEAEALLRQIHQRFPDYLFACTCVARLAIREGDLTKAKALLDPLLDRHRWHHTEFAALSIARIDLLLAEGYRDAAQSWFDLWKRSDPENPHLPGWQVRLQRKDLTQRYRDWRIVDPEK